MIEGDANAANTRFPKEIESFLIHEHKIHNVYKSLALALTIVLVMSIGFNYASAQVPQRISTELTIDQIELKQSRQVFHDFEDIRGRGGILECTEFCFFEGEIVEITGDLRTTVRAENIGSEEVTLTETGVPKAKIRIIAVNQFGDSTTVAETVTSSGGDFDVEWTVKIADVDRIIDLVAVYDGSTKYQPARSVGFSLVIRSAPLEIRGERGNMSVGVSTDPVVMRTGHLSRMDLEFHTPGSTNILDDVWYDFTVIQDGVKIREEKNVFAGQDRNVFEQTDEIFTHFFTTRSNNKITVSIYLRGIGESEDNFKPLNDLVQFTLDPLANREVGVLLNLDKAEYFFEEVVTVKGRIPSFEPVPLILQIKNVDGKACMSKILPSSILDSEGNFETSLRISEEKCQVPGKYQITTFYGSQKVESAFLIKESSATVDVKERKLFTMIRVKNAPFADSVYELRLVFPDKTVDKLRNPPEWFSYLDREKSMLIFFTDYNPILPSTAKIFKLEKPSEPVRVEWFTINNVGEVTGTGIITLR